MHLERGRRAPALGPAIPEHSKEFPAGAVTFSVEYRDISGNEIPDFWEVEPGTRFSDGGVTIHVFDAEDGIEHVRMDCFANDPHYHYSCPDSDEYLVVAYDAPANGDDMLAWSLSCLRERLGPMLASSRGAHLADRLDDAVVAAALDDVEVAARHVQSQPA